MITMISTRITDHKNAAQYSTARRLSGAQPNNSNSTLKVIQGGHEQATKTVHLAQLGASEEANAVASIKWNWNNIRAAPWHGLTYETILVLMGIKVSLYPSAFRQRLRLFNTVTLGKVYADFS
jgi:hypothetical protein